MKPTLNPYLNFGGTTAEAMKFYQSVLGGELTIQSFAEFGMPVGEDDKDKIMHAKLENDALTFMASDGNTEHPVHMGDNISMSISGSDEEILKKYYEGLLEGGKVLIPYAKQVWGDTFGMLIDKYGVQWMVNVTSSEPQK